MSQFLDSNGLTYLWGKIKDEVDGARALMVTGTITAVDPETYMPTAISVDKSAQYCRDAATAGNEVYLYVPMSTNALILKLVSWGGSGVTFSVVSPYKLDGTDNGILGIIGIINIYDDGDVHLNLREIPDITSNYYTSAQTDTLLASKQDTISDLSTIRSLASGSVQKAPTTISNTDLNTVKTAGAYITANCSNGYFSGTTLLQVISGSPYGTVQVQYPILGITSAASAFRICYGLNTNWTPWIEIGAPQEDFLIVRFYWATEEEEPEPEDYELTCDKQFVDIGTAFLGGKKIYAIYDGSSFLPDPEDINVSTEVASDGQSYITFYFSAGSAGLTKEVFSINSSDVLTHSKYYSETTANKVVSTTGIDSTSTDGQYPSAKAVYNAIQAGGGGVFDVIFTVSADPDTGDLVITSDKGFSDIEAALTNQKAVRGILNGLQVGMGFFFTDTITAEVSGLGLSSINFGLNIGTTAYVLTMVSSSSNNATLTQKGLIQADEGEYIANKVTSITSAATDIEYPSAKAVYDYISTAEKEAKRVFGEGHYASITYDGDETWSVNTALVVRDITRYRFTTTGFTTPSIYYSADTNFCFIDGAEYILSTDGNAGKKSSGVALIQSGSNIAPWVYMHPNNPITTVADFKTWLAAHPFTIYYPIDAT